MIELYKYQKEALNKIRNGSILCGGVGSGKSLTALFYYYQNECLGEICGKMKRPKDLYIITTAKKRDSFEWHKECAKCGIVQDENLGPNKCRFYVDSWNNIKKYQKVFGAFFIFDEQRLVGSGAWVKAFLDISRKNHWILLSATPGDQWSDYIPVFVANGFYKNKTDFQRQHCVFSRFSKYPKIEKYIGERILKSNLDKILVEMPDNRLTIRHNEDIIVGYDKELYRIIMKDRWNPFSDEPITETGMWCYLLRKSVNIHPDRIQKVDKILKTKNKAIIFYNFDYELEILRDYLNSINYVYSEWNGHNHDQLPDGSKWAYLVQYTAGCEGWNCITTDTIIFYSQNYSYRITEQARGRIDRINTPYKELYYFYLRSTASIDRAIHKALLEKKKFNERSFGQ